MNEFAEMQGLMGLIKVRKRITLLAIKIAGGSNTLRIYFFNVYKLLFIMQIIISLVKLTNITHS